MNSNLIVTKKINLQQHLKSCHLYVLMLIVNLADKPFELLTFSTAYTNKVDGILGGITLYYKHIVLVFIILFPPPPPHE